MEYHGLSGRGEKKTLKKGSSLGAVPPSNMEALVGLRAVIFILNACPFSARISTPA